MEASRRPLVTHWRYICALKLNKMRSETAPVRAKDLLAPSIIARVATDILGTYAVWVTRQAMNLLSYSARFWVSKKKPSQGDRQFDARNKAAGTRASARHRGQRACGLS